MKTIKLFSLILALLNFSFALSMEESEKPIKSNKIKQLKLILKLTQNQKSHELKKLRNLTLREVKENPDEEVIALLKEKNIIFKKNKIKDSYLKKLNDGELEKSRLLISLQDEENSDEIEKKFFINACKSLNFKCIKSLMESGINFNTFDEEGNHPMTILFKAMANQNELNESKEYLEVIALFFNLNPKIYYNENLRTILRDSISGDLYKTIKIIIKNITHVDVIKDENGRTAFILAVIKCNQSIKEKNSEKIKYSNRLIKLLIEEGADIDIKDENGRTALMQAVIKCNQSIKEKNSEEIKYSNRLIKLLIEEGVDIIIKDDEKKMARDYVESEELWSKEIIDYLTPNFYHISEAK